MTEEYSPMGWSDPNGTIFHGVYAYDYGKPRKYVGKPMIHLSRLLDRLSNWTYNKAYTEKKGQWIPGESLNGTAGNKFTITWGSDGIIKSSHPPKD